MDYVLKVLLVDDNPYFLDVIRDYLQLQKGIDVVGIARDGKEALAQALKLEPNLILLDLNLGSESGLPLIPLLKRHLPNTKILVLTIIDEESYRVSAMQAGADAFIHKMDMGKTLLSVISALMDRSS